MSGTKQTDSTDSQVLLRIHSKGAGWVFTLGDFADLGTSTAVRLALMRHQRDGTIRRLARGLYDFPRRHNKLGMLAPSPDAIAQALQAKDGSRLQPTGAYAANMLGLSDQVPARAIFFTDGRSKRLVVGRQEIVLLKRSIRTMATAGRPSGIVIQALEFLGEEAIDDSILARLRSRFAAKDLRAIAQDARYARPWAADVLRKLAREAQEGGQLGASTASKR